MVSLNGLSPFNKFVKDKLGKELVGVEIGTYSGENALEILKNLDIKTLYLIDPYIGYYDGGKKEKYRSQIYMRQVRNEMLNNLKDYKEKVKPIYKSSIEAVNKIPDNVDFIYIDGDHSYEAVKKDIELYYNKVKSGGIFGGDDIKDEYPGVIKAVKEFSENFNKEIISSSYKSLTQKNKLGYIINCNWMCIK